MLKNEVMWLTDVRYLNDSEEMRNGVSILMDYVRHRVDNFSSPHPFFASAVKYVDDGLLGNSHYGLGNRPVFIGSFSRAGNLLSQWRAYGSYAIEFDSDFINQELFNCVYDRDEKLSHASNVALLKLIEISKDLQENSGVLTAAGREAFSDIVAMVASFKHDSFSEEQEVRVVLGHDNEPGAKDGLEVKFRGRGNILVPYVEASLPLESVRAIHVGPMRDQELACISMKSLVDQALRAHSFASSINHKIDVVKSDIPYRAP